MNIYQHLSQYPQVKLACANYPEPLSSEAISATLEEDSAILEELIGQSKKICLIVEDTSRNSKTAELIGQISRKIKRLQASDSYFRIVMAAGAHYWLKEKDLQDKVGIELWEEIQVHNCIDEAQSRLIGYSSQGIPFIINKLVAEADLRLSISTVNIHPLAGFSGGGKILLPGVSGLETIKAFHALPPVAPGLNESPMRRLIEELLIQVPIKFSWQMITNPDGAICKLFSGEPFESYQAAQTELLQLIKLAKPPEPIDLLVLGCHPFDRNLIGTCKSLHQIPAVLEKNGRAVLINDAPQGIGDHYWRLDPEVIKKEKLRFQESLGQYKIAVWSKKENYTGFMELFPDNFTWLDSNDGFSRFIANAKNILLIPYAPLTLIS